MVDDDFLHQSLAPPLDSSSLGGPAASRDEGGDGDGKVVGCVIISLSSALILHFFPNISVCLSS